MMLLSLALVASMSVAASDGGINHGIYGGFNPQWVCPNYGAGGGIPTNALVSLTVGSAIVDGEQTYAQGMALYPFPDDIPAITPSVPSNAIGQRFVAYCYVADVNGGGAGSAWFAHSSPSMHPFDFICGASTAGMGAVDWSPTPDGHPHSPLPYGGITTTHAIFVGSVVGNNILQVDSACGGGRGAGPSNFSVLPFYRNGSQVIYDTATTCALTYTLDGGYNTTDGGIDGGIWCNNLIDAAKDWDLGIPAWPMNGTAHGLVPIVFGFDFTHDGLNDTLPLSASQIILDSEAQAESAPDAVTECFMDPNVPTIDPVTQQRSCQAELMVDAPGNLGTTSPYLPVSPYRARLNIADAGTGYGVIWVGGAGAPLPVMGEQIYIDLSYRGYVEPERQLVPQISLH